MIVAVGSAVYRGADVVVVFRELWLGAKGTEVYSDQRGEFIVRAMRSMAGAAVGEAPGAKPEDAAHAVEALMRRVETDRLNTPAHLLALGGLLGCYILSDESPRDSRALDKARENLRTAWWASGLDRSLLKSD
jgi:hypothetical protein